MKICPVCLQSHGKGTSKQVQSVALCPAHQKLYDEGYIVLIGIDTEKSPKPFNGETAVRTGNFMHIKCDMYETIFDSQVENEFNIAICDDKVILDMKARFG